MSARQFTTLSAHLAQDFFVAIKKNTSVREGVSTANLYLSPLHDAVADNVTDIQAVRRLCVTATFFRDAFHLHPLCGSPLTSSLSVLAVAAPLCLL